MSTAIAKNFQIGADSTPSNNFTLYQPASPDGTLRLGNGNTGITSSLLTLTSAGNLGLGVTPSAWGRTAFEIGVAGASITRDTRDLVMLSNAYWASGGLTYAAGAGAGRFDVGVSGFRWYTAPSGTAGNAISFTQAMTLDASGRLFVGNTFSLSNAFTGFGANTILDSFGQLSAVTTDSQAAGVGGQVTLGGKYRNVGGFSDYCGLGAIAGRKENSTDGNYAGYLQFLVSNMPSGMVERARIDSSGNLGVGTTSPSTRLHARGSGGTIATFERDASGTIAYFNRNTGGGNAGAIIGADSLAGYFAGGNSTSNMVYLDSVNNLAQFFTNNSERARIDSSGRFLVGKTSAGDYVTGIEMQPAGAVLSYRDGGVAAIFGRTTNGETVRFTNNGTGVGNISTTGSATAYNTSSDYRLKNSIAPMTGALAKVAALKPVTYKWNADGSDGQGFIAHELAEVCPDAVTGEKDAVNEDGSIKPQGIDTSFLVATLTAAIQELKAEFDAYKATHP